MVGYPGANALDVVGPLEVFAVAARLAPHAPGEIPAYTTEIVASRSGPLETQSGIGLVASGTLGGVRGAIDTLLVAGGLGTAAALERSGAPFRRPAPRGARAASGLGVHRELRPRRRGTARRPPRHDALDVVPDARVTLPARARRAGSRSSCGTGTSTPRRA